MKNKDKVFERALEVLEAEKFSCNALRKGIRNINDMDLLGTVQHTREYREMFGFIPGDDGDDIDPFVRAINKHCSDQVSAFEFRVLLLSLAQVAWDDIYPKWLKSGCFQTEPPFSK